MAGLSFKRRHRALLFGLLLFVLLSLTTLSGHGSVLLALTSMIESLFVGAKTSAENRIGQFQFESRLLPLPAEYKNAVSSSTTSDGNLKSGQDSVFCHVRFSTKFLDDFRRRKVQYCSDESTSSLTCFHTVNSGSFTAGSIDSFCIAQHSNVFDVQRQKFASSCQVRDLSDKEIAAGMLPFEDIQSYQYLTGPKYMLKEWIDLAEIPQGSKSLTDADGNWSQNVQAGGHGRSFVILLKREVDGNVWHCLNELMAIMITLDVLRMTTLKGSPSGDQALFLPEDVTNTEIVILDQHPDGPYFDLFRMFSGQNPMRLAEWIASKQSGARQDADSSWIPIENIIIPYAGAANTLWTDWVRLPDECVYNEVLQVFVQRIFDLYGLPRARARQRPRPDDAEWAHALAPSVPRLTVTIVLRKDSRRLVGLDSHLLEAMKTRFSQVADFQLVDFAGLPFREQIEIARDTDVLVGMHGAGLTHAMFMEEGRGALVEVQPDRLCHSGFRNLAQMTGHAYFIAGANKIVGHCYRRGTGSQELEMMPDDGTALPWSWDISRCWSYTTNPEDWSFACSDPKVTGGEQSYMVCRNREASDEWYSTCTKKEAPDMYWLTRYVMEEERLLGLVGRAISFVQGQHEQAADEDKSR